MAYTYDIQTSKKDKISSNSLFACHTLGSVIKVFVSTFLIAYIYDFTNGTFDYILNTGIYQLCLYGTYLLTYWIFALICDSTNRVWVYRFAQILRLIFLISIIFWGKELAQIVYVPGILYGLCDACYYSSYNVLKQEMVSRKSMSKFSVLVTASCKTMDAAIPVILGALIQVSTYQQTAIYVAALIAIILLISFWIKAKKPKGSKFSLKEYMAKLKNTPEKSKIAYIYKTTIVYGFTTISDTLLVVCIMLHFGSSLSLGSITSIVGAVSIIELLLVMKFTKPAKRDWLYWFTISMPIIASILFVSYPTLVTVVIYKLFMQLSGIIYSAIYDIYRNSTLKEAGLYSEISEHHTIVENILSIFRIISFVILILVGLLQNLIVFYVMLVVFSLSYSGVNLCMFIYEKKYCKENKTETVEVAQTKQE